MDANPVLVDAWRGTLVESRHRGALAVVDADGRIVVALGDIERPVFPRSAVKLLQALPLVASGAADRFGLTDDELALACASHSGEPAHVRTAAAMLAKAGLDAGALECGVHWPSREAVQRAMAAAGEVPGALHNNCSGKHAGFVGLGCLMAAARGADARTFVRGYVQRHHPVMREVTAALQAATGFDPATAPLGTDGCSIPTYGIALSRLALGFARVATGVGLSAAHAAAARRLRRAVAAAPFIVAGTNRFDTRVMQRLGERVCCKVGAEGVYCAALPARGLGVALKIDDGATRAAEVAMAAVIDALVTLDDDERAFVRELGQARLVNWNGLEVGALRATDALRETLAAAV
ncbi:asparaginase [Azohydromonas sediminis]|uniref:asparaginase n=1 Tax=Azohydromonas sediminis TaxID=2259674 RepID=UPI000E65AD00|nr:asparaginase [Azohydromonas sediminis]